MTVDAPIQIASRSIGSQPSCNEIPFELVSTASTRQKRVPVTSGVCVPKGQLFEPGEWLVEAGGAHLQAQTEVLNRWSDGSVRWLLTRFVAGRVMPGRTSCSLLRPEKRAEHFSATTTLQRVNNGLRLYISDPHKSIESSVFLTPEMADVDGHPLALTVDSVKEEVAGNVCSVFAVDLTVTSTPCVKLQLTVEVWPGSGLVRTDVRIRNTRRARHKGGLWDLGDAGSFEFGGLSLNVASEIANGKLQWKAESTSEVRECQASDGLQIVQSGSGSANWANSNHVGADLKLTTKGRGYRADSVAGTLRGHRSEPTVCVSDATTQLSVTVPEFWQQFPGSLSVDNNGVHVGFFPTQAGPFELQGGEQKTQSAWTSTRHDHSGVEELDWVHQPPRMMQSADWVRKAGVIQWLPQASQFDDGELSRYSNYIAESTTAAYSMDARRNKIDEFGWRNFGDVPADHEQTNYVGSNTIVSHYNNQFDLVFGGVQNLILSADPKWFDLFDPLARHIIDIDIYHTDEDRSCFNGGLFWHTDHYVDAVTATHRTYSARNSGEHGGYGGGPSNEHNYTTGLMYYHFLTGNRNAFDAVISLADWVIGMDDGTKTIFGLFDSSDTGLASQTKYEDFHGPGRGVGNSINALLDAWILSGKDKYLSKLEQLIRRSVHPNQDCDELQLGDAEKRWSYTVCMTAMGRYLAEKLEAGQLDEHYDYARRSLENYGKWMLANERPTLSAPENLEYLTEAWAAQDFRKANALRIAASCTDDTAMESQMRAKADELNDAAWKDLYAFDDKHKTARCLSIVMTEGLRDLFHRTCRPEYLPPSKVRCSDSEWSMFVPQKQRIKQTLKHPIKAVLAATHLLSPRRLSATFDALRRQF